jgi:hypothetical protein
LPQEVVETAAKLALAVFVVPPGLNAGRSNAINGLIGLVIFANL